MAAGHTYLLGTGKQYPRTWNRPYVTLTVASDGRKPVLGFADGFFPHDCSGSCDAADVLKRRAYLQRHRQTLATLGSWSVRMKTRSPNKSVLVTCTKTRIWGSRNSWSLAPHRGFKGECKVDLEIQGDEHNGYHLVMRPAGFFTADEWYASKDGALAAASKLFGIA